MKSRAQKTAGLGILSTKNRRNPHLLSHIVLILQYLHAVIVVCSEVLCQMEALPLAGSEPERPNFGDPPNLVQLGRPGLAGDDVELEAVSPAQDPSLCLEFPGRMVRDVLPVWGGRGDAGTKITESINLHDLQVLALRYMLCKFPTQLELHYPLEGGATHVEVSVSPT